MKISIVSIIVCVMLIETTNCGKIPSFIPRCKANHKHISKCMREAIEFTVPQILNGVDELDIPKLDPLRIPDIDIFRDVKNSSSFTFILKDMDVYGIPNYQLKKIKANIPTLTFQVEMILPLLTFSGNYKLDSKAFVPVRGEGRFSLNAINIVARSVHRGEVEETNGNRYVQLIDLDLKVKIGDYRIRFENLFGGNEGLGETANEIINGFSQEFLAIATPLVQERVSEILFGISNKICQNMPFEELFPEK